MTAGLQVVLSNLCSKLTSTCASGALSARSSHLGLLLSELALKVSILLSLISLRAVTLWEFNLTATVLNNLTHISSWVS